MKFNPLKLAAKYPTPATPKYSFSMPPKEGPKDESEIQRQRR